MFGRRLERNAVHDWTYNTQAANNQDELPDDSGEVEEVFDLPDDSGDEPCEELPDDSGEKIGCSKKEWDAFCRAMQNLPEKLGSERMSSLPDHL